MSNLPKGHELDNNSKLQNVVTGIIFREYKPFTKEDIYTKVEKWCEGSPYGKDGAKRPMVNLDEMVENTLDTLFVIGSVKYDSIKKQYELDMNFPAV